MAQLSYTQLYYLLSADMNVSHRRLKVPYHFYIISYGYLYEAN